jgi:hypothetical protein
MTGNHLQHGAGQPQPLPAKARLNFWIDWLTTAVFAAMLGGGILLRWILPPGSRGGAGLSWLGHTRHYYGDIHFWTAIALLALVVVHVWLHWDWVVKTWRRAAGSLRSPLTWVMLLLIAVLIFAPLLIPRQASTGGDGGGEHHDGEHADRQYGGGQHRYGGGGPD